jgi:hypothetical protein
MIKVIEKDGYKKVVATTKIISEGNVLYECAGRIVSKPTRTSIQTPFGHIEDDTGACINHNCNPNMMLEFINNSIQFVNIHEIKEDDELTFDYNTTEYELSSPFECACCGELIKGYKYE